MFDVETIRKDFPILSRFVNGKPLVYLDTHIVCWLYEGRSEKLSKKAAYAIESGILTISLIVDLKLQYLYEIGRIRESSDKVLSALAEEICLKVADTSLALIY